MTDDFDDIIRASRRLHHGRKKSAVRQLIEEKFDQLVAAPVSWGDLADRLNATGMRDAYGRKLTARHLTQTFYLVSKARRHPAPPARGGTRAPPPDEPSDEPFQIRSINKETP